MESVRLSLASLDRTVLKRGKPTTPALTIQSNTCALCGLCPPSTSFVAEDRSVYRLCRDCYRMVSKDTPRTNARKAFAALFKETP